MKRKNYLFAMILIAFAVSVVFMSTRKKETDNSYILDNLEALSHAQESSSEGGFTIERYKCKDSFKEQIVCKRYGNDECQPADCFF